MLFELLYQELKVFGRQDAVPDKVVTQPLLMRTLEQKDRIHLKYREQSKFNGLFSEQPLPRTIARQLFPPIVIEPFPPNGNVPDGRSLSSLPDQRFDKSLQGYTAAIIKVLADLQYFMRDSPSIIGIFFLVIRFVIRHPLRSMDGITRFLGTYRRRRSSRCGPLYALLTLPEEEIQDVIGADNFAEPLGLFLLDMDRIGGKEVGVVFLGLLSIGGLDAVRLDDMNKITSDVDVAPEERTAGKHDLGISDHIH